MEIMNKVDTLETCEQIPNGCPLKSEVESYKEDIDNEKKDSIIKIIF